MYLPLSRFVLNFSYQNSAEPNSNMPIMTAIIVANITAPAEISFAIPTSFEYLLWNTASSENSIAELNISATTTSAIANKSIHNRSMLKLHSTPSIITKAPANKCIRMFCSLFIANRIPFLAFLKVFENPCALNFVIPFYSNTFQRFLLHIYNKIIFIFCLVVKSQ